MLLRPLTTTALVLGAALTAACGGGSTTTSDATPSPTGTVTTSPSPTPAPTTASTSVSASVSASPSASATAAGLRRCAPQGKLQVVLVTGTVDCAAAYAVTGKYDFDGEKRQTVDGYVCETGNAMTRPTVLTCTDRRNRDEFSVDEK